MPKCSQSDCAAEIVFRRLADYHTQEPIRDSNLNPIDAEPVPMPEDTSDTNYGNILLLADDAHYVIVPSIDREMFVGHLHRSHFVTCKAASAFRNKKVGGQR